MKFIKDLYQRYVVRSDDPVKHCQKYLKEGCSHVDGFLCSMGTCDILHDFKKEQLANVSNVKVLVDCDIGDNGDLSMFFSDATKETISLDTKIDSSLAKKLDSAETPIFILLSYSAHINELYLKVNALQEKIKALENKGTKNESADIVAKIKGNTYCLGVGCMDKCKTCQHEFNWDMLNRLDEVEHGQITRKEIQSNMTCIKQTQCQLTSGCHYLFLCTENG